MTTQRLRVGVLGAGNWARTAHIPGWQRDPRCDVVTVCDPVRERAEETAAQFGIREPSVDWQKTVARSDLDIIDVATPSQTHQELAVAALESGKHVLCEKPVAYDFRETLRAASLAKRKGRLTKLGFTFRYSPGVQYARELIDQGFVGTPFIFNGYEQNSQWLNPQTPLRQVDPKADPAVLHTASLEGYGAPIIDISMWWVGAGYTRVTGTMRNFIPERMVRATGKIMRMNIDDGDIYLAEYSNGAIGSVQTSFVTIGNYPGIEARIYGERGRDHLPPGGGVWGRRDDQDRDARRGRVQGAGDPETLLSHRRPRPGVLALAVLRQPHQGLRRRDHQRHRPQPGELRRRRPGAGSDQRRGTVVPRAALGRPPAAAIA